MRYIHTQLCLRADVFDDFHMLMWRHLLSSDIPRLEELARIVNPHMGSIPSDLCPAIVSFLRTYGPRLWPSSTRSHLTTSPTRLSGQGYWQPIRGLTSNLRPEYCLDKTMTASTLKKWQKNAPSNTAAPLPEESALHSPLGQLLRVYMFAALNLSTVDDSYEKAITLREKDLLHQILIEDEDAVQQDPFLTDAAFVKVQYYLSLTGDMGGLP